MPRQRLAGACAAAVGALALIPAAAGAATINVVAGMGEPVGGDDDQCSLREAITTANANSAVNNGGAGPDCTVGQSFTTDTINLPAGTYAIAASSEEQLNASGDYDIQLGGGPLAIAGAGAAGTIIDANDHDRVMHAFGAQPLTLTGLTLTDGTTTNNIGGGGGGILIEASGTTTLSDVDITNSVASNSPGGGISTNSIGTQVFTDISVTGNDSNGAGTGPKGGGISFRGGTSTITDSTISGNEFDHANDTAGIGVGGGGISYDSAAGGTITRTTIAGNSVDTLNADQFPGGGGVLHEQAAGNLTITDSTIAANTVTGGSNRSGGGLEWNSSSPPLDQLRIDNTTISGNSVTAVGNSQGGGIRATSGTLDLANVTFTGNTAASSLGDGMSISTNNQANGSTFELRGSILDEGGADECHATGINAAFASLGHNIERGPTNDCGFAGTGDQLLNISPISATLAANGGPTQTHAIASGSAARDVIPPGSCLDSAGVSQASDQRGAPRPFGANCDVGAYEYSECVGSAVNVVGTAGADVINGTAGADGILALGGGDTIDAGGGADRVCAGQGDDTFLESADSANDQILGEGGSDTISLENLPANAYSVSVSSSGLGVVSGGNLGSDFPNSFEDAIGSTGADTLTGDATANVLEGRDGDDSINGGGGDDTLTGGEGGETNGDTMSFVGSNVPVTFDLAGSSPQNTGHGNDTWSQMENATGGDAADTLRGDAGSNILNGGFGPAADTLEGRGGNDVLDGSSANDGGGDTVVYDEAAGGVTVDLSDASAQNTQGDGTDTILDTENVTGSAHGDLLTGSSANNTIDGGASQDIARFAGATGVVANLATDLATGAGNDQLPNIEGLEGSAGIDTLTGDAGPNELFGLGEADTITGGGGSDDIFGGAGADELLARDGVSDDVDCGPGDLAEDTVESDLSGVDVIANCEEDSVTFAEAVPNPPVLTGSDPASPANQNQPRIRGTTDSGTTVSLYATAGCTGAPVATGSEAQFEGTGITVTVPDNSTTTFRARATGAGGASACSASSVTYAEVTPPSPPVLTGSAPRSPADQRQPRIKGTTDAGTTVRLYTDASCSGAPVATGSEAQLEGTGIPVAVPHSSTTTFRATAAGPGGTSACSQSAVTYTERCKKGFKLKKIKRKGKKPRKKCVRKKKRRK